MNAFMAHPSVRIKGTENNYEPVACISPHCPNRNPHMHCPFCTRSESFHDPVILKAHFRVKHVDKGIDFAGLKILRCCDHCDIVGTIKGTKEFKGAHWHCYRCRNGFNRRDEAIKHYRTHFRNPQTTFQIQVAQEVNQQLSENEYSEKTITEISQNDVTESILSSSNLQSNEYSPSEQFTSGNSHVTSKDVMGGGGGGGELQVSVAANETVGAEGQTIMIIQADDQLDASQVAYNNEALEAEKAQLEEKIQELQHKYQLLEGEYKSKEQKRLIEISNLKEQIKSQSAQVAALQQREAELLDQLSIPLDEHIQEVLTRLKSDHEELLHQQLAKVRRTYIQQYTQQSHLGHNLEQQSEQAEQQVEQEMEQEHTQPLVLTTKEETFNTSSDQATGIVFVQSPGGSNIRLVSSSETSQLGANTQQIVVLPPDGSITSSENHIHVINSQPITELHNSTVANQSHQNKGNSEMGVVTYQAIDDASDINDTTMNETIVQVRLVPPPNVSVKNEQVTREEAASDLLSASELSPDAKRRKLLVLHEGSNHGDQNDNC